MNTIIHYIIITCPFSHFDSTLRAFWDSSSSLKRRRYLWTRYIIWPFINFSEVHVWIMWLSDKIMRHQTQLKCHLANLNTSQQFNPLQLIQVSISSEKHCAEKINKTARPISLRRPDLQTTKGFFLLKRDHNLVPKSRLNRKRLFITRLSVFYCKISIALCLLPAIQ